eukprot:TRINITY_DN28000_c0_g1_i1.p1 TRINITY_DN28000_c0_g1~~TRINITY_DN28000_c0_g1_i1.p1  ORF type:complete len:455 (+),score=168.70 TRINITY_DN28000_c0_g1_i1:72-1436(+)
MAPKIRMKLSRPRTSQGSQGSAPSESPQKQHADPGMPPPAPSPSKRPREGAADDSAVKKRKVVLKRSAGDGSSNNNSLTAPSPSYGYYREGGLSPGYGRSPAYGKDGAGGMSPYPYAAGLSPAYARLKTEDLGGVLSVSVENMLKELSPNGVIKGDIHVASTTDTLGAALDKMAAYKVMALPVMDESGKFMDIVDTQDLVKLLVAQFTEVEIFQSKTPATDFASGGVWHEMATRGKDFLKKKTVADVLAERREEGDAQVTHLDATATVKDLLTAFVKNRTTDGRPFHRLVLLTPEGRLRAMVSQSDIIKYLYKHQDVVKNLASCVTKSLTESKLTQRKVLVATKDSSVLYVLHKMCKYKSHMAAIVDGDRKLVQHFSASDLRGITSATFPVLLSKVHGFGDAKPPFTLLSDMSLWAALELFVAKRLHRASVVDDLNRPFALVSISNLLSAFMKL